jgi:ribonucleoside-diphosphate reductase subunit M2
MTDFPAKKLDFASADKENVFKPIVGIPVLEEETSVVEASVAPTIKPEEAHEPLLQANSQRFVLFPIKYHDVSFLRPTRSKTRRSIVAWTPLIVHPL